MIDTDKYEGHAEEGWHFDSAHVLRDGHDKEIAELVGEDWLDDKATQELIADAPKLLAEVKVLQYLEMYAPSFQVFALNEEEMDEEYTQHTSVNECEKYIAALEDGWVGTIEVIEYYVPTNNPQVKTLEEWRNEE